MKYGFVVPTEDPKETVEFVLEAEALGWDGFFVSESMWSTDAWLCLAAAAVQTERIKLGTLLTPLSTMRPWKLAVEAATLDQLSNGRAIITVGMGALDTGFAAFGEETDLRTRAELVDEGLEIMDAIWKGKSFVHQGKHYAINLDGFVLHVPLPVQQPRVPVWVVAAWPRPKSMARALRCEGVVPMLKPKGSAPDSVAHDDLRAMIAWIQEQRDPEDETRPLDIVVEGTTPGDDPDAANQIVQAWADAGATWWIESVWGDPQARMDRLRQGPPSYR